jgi:predicted nucleotidyltransferase
VQVEVQIERLLDGVREVLGEDVVGAYLHGSAVLGGGGPRSDVDVIAVARRRTSVDEKRRLATLLLEVSGRRGAVGPPRPIEFDLVVESEIRPWRYPPPFDLHYSELWRKQFESGELEPWSKRTNRDLASVVTMVLAGNTALFGPPPADVFDPVPRRDYHDAILKDVETVEEFLPRDTRNVILTLPRVWAGLATEQVHSKESAGAWGAPSRRAQAGARARAGDLSRRGRRFLGRRPAADRRLRGASPRGDRAR